MDKAVLEKRDRSSLIETKIQEMIQDGSLMIDTKGSVVGQVNGLSVFNLGDTIFGKPSRITAQVAVGTEGIINIEREAELSGSLHDKGVLIISGFMRARFAHDKPLAVTASLCFEQSYGGVDGDSASSTEIYALMSALSGVPISQAVAVTGSVNQKGEIQPIGGVNEKIEGFFDVCRARKLTGEHGVIIPHQNASDLMLRQDVVEAVAKGEFHVWPVRNVDEGMEIKTPQQPFLKPPPPDHAGMVIAHVMPEAAVRHQVQALCVTPEPGEVMRGPFDLPPGDAVVAPQSAIGRQATMRAAQNHKDILLTAHDHIEVVAGDHLLLGEDARHQLAAHAARAPVGAHMLADPVPEIVVARGKDQPESRPPQLIHEAQGALELHAAGPLRDIAGNHHDALRVECPLASLLHKGRHVRFPVGPKMDVRNEKHGGFTPPA